VASDADNSAAAGLLEQITSTEIESTPLGTVETNGVDFVSPRDDSIVAIVATLIMFLVVYMMEHFRVKDDAEQKAA
jgi:hypothetical protein